MTGLTEQKLLGIRNGGEVLCPPLEWDPKTGKELDRDFVEVGPAGTVESWSWVANPSEQHPLAKPFAFALIKLDGADTALVHAVDAGSIDAMSTGMRVAPRWRAERKGHITDIEAFVPGEEPQGGGGAGAEEPVTMMEYNASITYNTPIPSNVIRGEQANDEGRFLGFKCPECGRMYTSQKSFCPIDAVELTQEHEIDLPQTGVVSNYTLIEPVQYPGQTETERFSRVHVKLDGVDVVLGFQTLLDTPVDDVHVGMKVSAVWASEGEADDFDPRREGRLIGWMPTGEPDVDDPNLVNRMP
jgi:uncharacterized OB-fold protein